MNAPILWILIPTLLGIVLLLLAPSRQNLVTWIGSGASVLLALLAWLLPTAHALGTSSPFMLPNPTISVLGRTLTLDTPARPFLILVYSLAAVWFAGSRVAQANRFFIPLGLVMIAFLVAAIAVDPFLYAALFIEIAVLISIPLLSPPGQRVRPGILRYLIFQTLGMPFILFTGWMLSGVEAGSTDLALIVRASVMLGLGFTFLLAVFPFYTWIPLLAEQAQPYVAGFVFSLLPTVVLLFGLNFLNSYTWLRDTDNLYIGLRLIGTLMVVTGGVWSAFQQHLGRMLGYAVIAETGFSLLSISLSGQGGMTLFAMLFLPRMIGLATWVLCLSILQNQTGSLELARVTGFGRQYPLIMLGLVLSQLSIAGLPLLAGFPIKQILLYGVAKQSAVESFWILAGCFGLMLGALRSLNAFLMKPESQAEGDGGLSFHFQETSVEWIMVSVGILALILAGLFPQLFQPGIINLMKPFGNLPL